MTYRVDKVRNMTDAAHPWSDLERLLLDPKLLEADGDKNPKALRCPFCPKAFRFEDQVIAHVFSKHRNHAIHEVMSLRKELADAKEAVIAYRALARGRR